MQFKAHARTIGFVVLAVATGWGVYQFVQGDCESVLEYWRSKLFLLIPIMALATLDIALEAVGWSWVYERLGIRTWDRGGAWAYLSSRAGLLLPAQLSRLIRPDAMVRLRRAELVDCLKAEGVAFVLDSTSVFALLAGLATWYYVPLAAPFVSLAVIAVSLFCGNRVAKMLSGTKLALPGAFWWKWQTFAIVIIEMAGWFAHGLAFWVMIKDLSGNIGLWEPVFFAPASAVLGVGTGSPGGIGATEGLLGFSLTLMAIPAAHLALVVGAFRVLTFWIWIPIGWVALAVVKRRVSKLEQPPQEVSVEASAAQGQRLAPGTS